MTTRKWTLVASALLVLGLSPAALLAQQPAPPSQDELIQKRDAKLKAAFFSKATWITDYDQARAEAKKRGQPIFGYFSRSYAK